MLTIVMDYLNHTPTLWHLCITCLADAQGTFFFMHFIGLQPQYQTFIGIKTKTGMPCREGFSISL